MKTLIISCLIFSFNAVAYNYEIDWTSKNSKESILVITVDQCETSFKVKNEDLEAFANNRQALNDAINKSLQHKESGCHN